MNNDNSVADSDREMLSVLRRFAVDHHTEYGDLAVFNAIIDAGIALGMEDPTNGIHIDRLDLDGLRSWDAYDDQDIDAFMARYQRLEGGNDE